MYRLLRNITQVKKSSMYKALFCGFLASKSQNAQYFLIFATNYNLLLEREVVHILIKKMIVIRATLAKTCLDICSLNLCLYFYGILNIHLLSLTD